MHIKKGRNAKKVGRVYSVFPNVSHIFEIIFDEMSAYAQPTQFIFDAMKDTTKTQVCRRIFLKKRLKRDKHLKTHCKTVKLNFL